MASNPTKPATNRPQRRVTVGQILSMPPKWLGMYDDFITKNAGQVSQIESALRSLTYIIPGWWLHFLILEFHKSLS
jgi:peroxin-16